MRSGLANGGLFVFCGLGPFHINRRPRKQPPRWSRRFVPRVAHPGQECTCMVGTLAVFAIKFPWSLVLGGLSYGLGEQSAK
jgi:hypothetical protein